MNSKQHLSSERTEIMYCTQCGKPRQPDDRFCGYCGHPFRTEAEQHECKNAPRGEQYDEMPPCEPASPSDVQKPKGETGKRVVKAILGTAKFILTAPFRGPIGGALERDPIIKFVDKEEKEKTK